MNRAHAEPGQAQTTLPDPRLSNAEIADRLAGLAQLLSTQKENPYKIKAYTRAAAKIRTLSESVDELVRDDADLTAYAGIGEAIAGAIREIALTGTLGKLEKLRSAASPELASISAFPRLDPKRVLRIYKKLGIRSVEELRERLENDEGGKRRHVENRAAARKSRAASRRLRSHLAKRKSGARIPSRARILGSSSSLFRGNQKASGRIAEDAPLKKGCGVFPFGGACHDGCSGAHSRDTCDPSSPNTNTRSPVASIEGPFTGAFDGTTRERLLEPAQDAFFRPGSPVICRMSIPQRMVPQDDAGAGGDALGAAVGAVAVAASVAMTPRVFGAFRERIPDTLNTGRAGRLSGDMSGNGSVSWS